MIGVDTSVLLRAIVADDEPQHKQAANFFATRCTRDNPGFINLMVICELAWTLVKTYRYDRTQIADVIEALAATAELVVERRDHVLAALATYRTTNTGFADILIGTINRTHGCDTTVTFVRKTAKLDDFKLLT